MVLIMKRKNPTLTLSVTECRPVTGCSPMMGCNPFSGEGTSGSV